MGIRRADRLLGLHPDLVDALHQVAESVPFDLYVYEGVRSLERSAELYAQGRTRPGPIVSNAQPGQSPHNWRMAADVYPYVNGKSVENADAPEWAEFGAAVKLAGMTWGGDFSRLVDKPHVELPDWENLKGWDEQEPPSGVSGYIETNLLFALGVSGVVLAGLIAAAYYSFS